MLSDKVHVLIEGLNACHIGFCIICKFYFLSAADALCTPVKISHVYRTSYLTGDCVETCLPSLDRLAGSFRSKRKMNDRSALHFVDYAKCNIAATFSVDRNSSHLAEKPSEWSPEQFSLYHAVWLAAY